MHARMSARTPRFGKSISGWHFWIGSAKEACSHQKEETRSQGMRGVSSMPGHGGLSIQMVQSKVYRPCKVHREFLALQYFHVFPFWYFWSSLHGHLGLSLFFGPTSGLAEPFKTSDCWIVNAVHETCSIWSLWGSILQSEDPGVPMFFISCAATNQTLHLSLRLKPCCDCSSGFLWASFGRIASVGRSLPHWGRS